jgi:hypothetical protein
VKTFVDPGRVRGYLGQMNLTSQRITQLYETYAGTEVTFNTQVILESGLSTADVHLKVGDHHVPCVLYACSMKGARVVAELSQDISHALSLVNNVTSLRLGFADQGSRTVVTFFVTCRVESLSEYHPQKPHVRFITLEFTQRPSDSLIAVLGSILELKSNALRRRDERIVVTPDVMRKIGLDSKETCVAIAGSPRRCILRDISFGGAKVLMGAVGTPQNDKRVLLKLSRCELKDDTVLDGSIVRVEDVQGHEDLVALSIQFSSDTPNSYKQKINNVFAS